jgi:hypothetical protein
MLVKHESALATIALRDGVGCQNRLRAIHAIGDMTK